MKQLKLSYPAYDHEIKDPVEKTKPENIGYCIEQVVGDADYKPGQFLSQVAVRDLCDMTGTWKITIDKRRDGR